MVEWTQLQGYAAAFAALVLCALLAVLGDLKTVMWTGMRYDATLGYPIDLNRTRLDRPVTIVTAYYDIPSKRPAREYFQFMRNFLPKIPCHMYIFTEQKWFSRLNNFRESFTNRTKIIVKPFDKLEMAKRMDLWRQQKTIDREIYHSPELYALWNEKVQFLSEAIRDNVFDSDYFIWTDIGSFRNPQIARQLTSFPDTATTAKKLGTDKVYFLLVEEFVDQDRVLDKNGLPKQDFQDVNRLGGTTFGGHRTILENYHSLYYRIMDRMIESGRFVGKDQNVMATVAVMYPHLFHLVRPQPYLNNSDRWFYSLYYFSKH